MKTSAQKISSVLNNLKTSSYKELQKTIKAINNELRSGAVARNTDEWKQLNKYLRQCRNQLNFIKEEEKLRNHGLSVFQNSSMTTGAL